MSVQAIRIGDQTVLLEIVPVEAEDQLPAAPTTVDPANRRGNVPMENVSVASSLVDVAQRITATVGGVVRPVAEAMKAIDAEEWTVEMSFGFKGGAAIPFVVNGEANGAVKVSAKWKRG